MSKPPPTVPAPPMQKVPTPRQESSGFDNGYSNSLRDLKQADCDYLSGALLGCAVEVMRRGGKKTAIKVLKLTIKAIRNFK